MSKKFYQYKELAGMNSIGYEYLVKNKDGTVYFVDHGYTEIIKAEEQWEDKEYGFDENVFVEAKCNYDDLVSWDDEEPFDIYDYLVKNNIHYYR